MLTGFVLLGGPGWPSISDSRYLFSSGCLDPGSLSAGQLLGISAGSHEVFWSIPGRIESCGAIGPWKGMFPPGTSCPLGSGLLLKSTHSRIHSKGKLPLPYRLRKKSLAT